MVPCLKLVQVTRSSMYYCNNWLTYVEVINRGFLRQVGTGPIDCILTFVCSAHVLVFEGMAAWRQLPVWIRHGLEPWARQDLHSQRETYMASVEGTAAW